MIAGRLRRRKLHAPRGLTTRPTADRVRQALFELLGPMSDLAVLDLYAGTGALGIEALSRGAARAVFVENSRAALASLRRNLEDLGLGDRGSVLPIPVERAAKALESKTPFDLILCDPPWDMLDAAVRALERLLRTELCRKGGRVVIEHPAARLVELSAATGLERGDHRSWGDTAISLFVKLRASRADS